MFELALKAKLPFISVHTDDPVNFKAVLQVLAKKQIMPLPTAKNGTVGDSYIWYTEDPAAVTTDMYRRLCDTGASCVVVNPEKPNALVFHGGVLPTPTCFYTNYLTGVVGNEAMAGVVSVLRGLSPKSAQEVVQLTMARTGAAQPNEIRKTRQMLSGTHPGLYSLDTSYDFYEMPKPLQEWLDLNDKYFLNPDTPEKLQPRGLLLKGARGTGKSTAAMVLAHHWDVPLFRMDISTTINRWLGESETRLATNLSIIEQNAPCIYLMDEIEKVFNTSGDEGTTARMLSQMLWWLQFHKANVLTVMTSNDIKGVPEELYRPGRIDRVIEIPKLTLGAAKLFAAKVYESVMKVAIPMKRQKALRDALDKLEQSTIAHSDVAQLVYDLIKDRNWLQPEEEK